MAIYDLHQEFQRFPPVLLDTDRVAIPPPRVDFTDKLKELTLEQLQSLTENDIIRYALAIPSLIQLCSSRDLTVKECISLSRSGYVGTNMDILGYVSQERQALLQDVEGFNRKVMEFKTNLAALKPLSRVRCRQTIDAYTNTISQEIQALKVQQDSLAGSLLGEITSAQVQAYVQVRSRIRELEVLQNLIRT